MDQFEQSAELIFTSSAVILGIALILLSSTWKTLKEVLSKMPPAKRKIVFNLKDINDKREKRVEEIKGSLYLASIFLGFCILCNIGSMFCVVGIMLGQHGSSYETQDFYAGQWMLLASVALLTMSLFSLGWYRIAEAIAMKKGIIELSDELSSDTAATTDSRPDNEDSKK